ncbi:hypothetical protein DID88_009867 [Monilinia fructigena]|uniref:Uncharacterized protein n=1 Tax=Monilinia fructigena TaxID=38457 RepID=A0A395IK59_9HELO|nr:hypothetical protein DID88_009867 [Monilinia fructigena]
MSVRFANIHRLAEEKYGALLASGQTLEVLESQLRRELQTYPNLRSNPAQLCKNILRRVREARAIERAASLSLFPTPNPSKSPPRKHRAQYRMASSKIVVLKIENGYFAPKSIPISETLESSSAEPAKIVWEIKKRNLDANQVLAADTPTTISSTSISPATISLTPISPATMSPPPTSPVPTAPATITPTTISPVTLEYMGTNLTPSQLRYNSLARMADTKSIIAERIRFGMEEQDEVLEEATMRAHSWAECKVAMLAGRLDREERALLEQQALSEAANDENGS